jgi:hypothetical protein
VRVLGEEKRCGKKAFPHPMTIGIFFFFKYKKKKVEMFPALSRFLSFDYAICDHNQFIHNVGS